MGFRYGIGAILHSRQVLVDFYYTWLVFYGACVLFQDVAVPQEADIACHNQAVWST